MIDFFCIGHKPPAFSPEESFVHVTPGAHPNLIQLIIPDDSYGNRFHGSILSEYCQLFGLADYLKKNRKPDNIYVFQYRKFSSLRRGAVQGSNMPYAYACNRDEANNLFPSKASLAALGDAMMVGPAVKVQSLSSHYATVHHPEDFSCFAVALKSVDGFDDARIRKFVNCDVLFPAPSLGFFKFQYLSDHLETLKQAWEVYSRHYFKAREGYQRRVGGFLLERLHSYLIYEDILNGTGLKAVQGFQIVVSDSDVISRTE
jgi:hypothetical protein